MGDVRVKVRALKGNGNAVKHGFCGNPPLGPPRGGNGGEGKVWVVPTLDDEIALLASRRDAVDRWMMARLEAGDEIDVLKYLALIGQIGSRIARMLKTRQALGESGDVLEGLFSEVLDLLNERVDAEI